MHYYNFYAFIKERYERERNRERVLSSFFFFLVYNFELTFLIDLRAASIDLLSKVQVNLLFLKLSCTLS